MCMYVCVCVKQSRAVLRLANTAKAANTCAGGAGRDADKVEPMMIEGPRGVTLLTVFDSSDFT